MARYATLSSALNDAVRQRRLQVNVAKYAQLPRSAPYRPTCWTSEQAAAFLRYCAEVDDALTELFEVLVGTGLRKGEALALHWSDVDLDERVLFVRHTLSNVINTTPVFSTPTTRISLDGVGLSARVVAALRRQAERQCRQRLAEGGVP